MFGIYVFLFYQRVDNLRKFNYREVISGTNQLFVSVGMSIGQSVMLNLISDWSPKAPNNNQASDQTLVDYAYSVMYIIYIFQFIDHLNTLFQLIINCCI